MEYYSTIRKKKTLPSVTAWMGLEGIMLGEINQRKTKTPWYHLYVEPEEKGKVKLIETESRKCHNKENSTNCQNTERTPQTQQFKQDEETEEYPADKGTG